MSDAGRFVQTGLVDVDRGVGRLIAPALPQEQWVFQVIRSGALSRLAVRTADVCRRAAATSRVLAWMHDAVYPWRQAPRHVRRQAAGTVMLVASLVHVLLVLGAGAPAGWWWLILPGIAMALGAVLAVAGLERPPARER